MHDFQVGYFTIFLICLISSILILKLYKSSGVKPHLPPASFRLSNIGHLHLLGRIPHQAFHKLSNRHGPVFRLFLGSTPYVVVTTPETAKEVLKTHENAFLDRPHYLVGSYLSYGEKGLLLAPYGSYWKFLKKIMMSELLNGKTLDLLYPVRHDEINRFIKYLSEKAEDSKSVELERELMKGFGKRSKDVHRRYDTFMERIIEEHRVARKQERGEAKDMLSILLDISEDESMETKLTREDIKALIKDVFNGGTDTNAITVEWALAELINHPKIMKNAVDEIDQVVGKNRLPTQDCTVGGYHIPANIATIVNVWSLNRDPAHWESPLEFKPERFEGNQLDVRGQHFHLLPFGAGRRLCPGTSLSLLLVPTILGAMIQCFEWKTWNNETVDMEEGVGITIPRANPLVCVPVARLDPIPLSV
ncbi:hypothetical protein L1987_50965 [Smallanthus sonchifolius]|uniref:Uncharacterized protein n=1 Tax=Smallanthus sonchifolius TaxID=185202 RepID=A0ACB9ENI2_9ASTR|nr:hypothetical protein L1987_50965 [Smallanthus sonchifolius]